MRARIALILGLAAACGRSGSSPPPLLAAATIGPEGGVLEVGSGKQAGLRLTVPPGALAEPTELRVRDVPWPGTEALATSIAEPPGYPFLLEPVGLELGVPATLRAPYDKERIQNTAPGNVRVRETRSGNAVDRDPGEVDVTLGHVELPIAQLSMYQVILGPRAQHVGEYFQATGTTVELADGWAFAVEEVPLGSPFQPTAGPRWRITSPLPWSGQNVDLLYFTGERMVGRESLDENWREVWSEPYPVWSPGRSATPVGPVTMPMQVTVPLWGLAIGGQITVYGAWTWEPPRRIGDRILYDIVQLHVALTWSRIDLGVGQREYRFWFAPGVGLVALAEDGVEHVRTAL